MPRDWGVTARLVDARPDWSIAVFDLLTLPGDLLLIVGVLGILYLVDVWRHRDISDNPLCSPHTATTFAIVFGGLALIVFLESIFAAPRPPDAWHAISASPYAFPSGHTMAATVCWGALAWRHWHAPALHRVLSVGLLVTVVGISRMILGVHYLPDILAALGFGIAYLAIASKLATAPARAFAGAITLAVLAILASGAGTRPVLAFIGTAAAAIGWYVTERPLVRSHIRAVLAR